MKQSRSCKAKFRLIDFLCYISKCYNLKSIYRDIFPQILENLRHFAASRASNVMGPNFETPVQFLTLEYIQMFISAEAKGTTIIAPVKEFTSGQITPGDSVG